MKTIFKTAAFLFLSALCTNSNAQVISADDQKGIEECYNSFMSAFEKLDATNLGALLTDNAEHIVPNGQIFRGRNNVVAAMKGYMEYLKTLPKPDQTAVKNVAWQSRYLATDVILSTYTEETSTTVGSKTTVEKLTSAIVLHKVKGKWLADLIALTPVVEMPKQ